MAQDLLGNCINVEKMFGEWYLRVNPALLDLGHPPSFWVEDPEVSNAQIPFADTFAFRDSATAVMFVHFWALGVLFYPCLDKIHAAIFQPVVDVYPQILPELPANLQTNVHHGVKEVRELAANVCRGLDFALATTVQPDMLSFPLHVVEEFYREINTSSGDGVLEIMWCDAFRARLTEKGQDISHVVQSQTWMDLAQY
jgi:(R)-2-hydroxyglutarate---pyruvate transhydrogenase